MAGFFHPDNGFFRASDKLVDLFLLSIFWLFCSIPIVTIGPSTAALYNTVTRCIRRDERNSWAMFFRTFRENLKVGILTTLAILPVAVVLIYLRDLIYQTAAVEAGYVLNVAYQVFLLLPLGAACYLFPVLSRFTFRTGGLLLNCTKLAMAHLPSTVGMGLLLTLAIWACSILPVLAVILPALMALVQSLLLERIFRPYILAQRAEDWEDTQES